MLSVSLEIELSDFKAENATLKGDNLWQVWANSLSIRIEVNVIDDRADISLELTNTRVSHRAALMPLSCS